MQSIIVTTLYLLSIFVPLTFTTINHELFEFPKFVLMLAGTLVITATWLAHAFTTRDYTLFQPAAPRYLKILHYSVLIFLASQIISLMFSIHPYTSLWGYYTRFHGGVLTTICYTIIYFAIVKWMDTKSTQKLIKIMVGTSFFIGLYAIAERLGIDKNLWIQDVQSRPFSTLGQPNWLAAYLIPNIFLTLYLAQTKKLSSLLSFSIYLVLFIALIFTRSRSGFIGFSLSYLTYWLLLLRQFKFAKIKQSLILATSIYLLASLLFGTPYSPSLSSLLSPRINTAPIPTPQGTQLDNGGTESGDIRKIVWEGALRLTAKHPIVGTGPETFAYTYYWERPTAHNLTTEWDFLYNKAHNEYLNMAATTGAVGLLAYLAFHGAIFLVSLTTTPKSKKVVQENDDNLRHYYPVIGAAVVGFAVTNFFGFSVIPVYLTMITLAGIATSIHAEPTKYIYPLPYPLYFIIPVILIYPIQIFFTDLSYAKGKNLLDAGQPAKALPLLQRASNARPGLDLYHSTLGEAYVQLGQKEQALREVEINRQQNPYHLNYYKSRAKVYLTLASVDPSFHQQAADELEKARKLAPTDPKLAYNLGLVYTRLDDIQRAESNLQDAVTLRPIYPEPYYALTLLYEQTKQAAKLPDLLTSAKSNLATYSSQLKEKIEKYAAQ